MDRQLTAESMDAAKPGWLGVRSIRVTIMASFVFLLLATAIPIIGYMHRRSTAALIELADDLMVRCSEGIMEKTTHYLGPAATMAEMCARIGQDSTLALTSDPVLEANTIAVLQAHPQLAMFNLADSRGNFLMPKKMPDGSIATKVIDREASPPTVTWKYRDRAGKVIRTETETDVAYDPRTRPWYKGASEARSIYWTGIYILFTDQIPGITTAYPLIGADGEVRGVFSLDIKLGSISKFLRSLDMGSDGVAVIFNEKDEVIAYPDITRVVTKKGDKLVPTPLAELGDARISQCLATYRESGAERFTFRSGTVDYIGSITTFPESFGKAWKIGLVVPQQDFIGSQRNTSRNTLLIALAILLGAVVAAHQLARTISRPIVALAEEARQIQSLRFDEQLALDSPIAEIQGLRNALASMKVGLSAFGKYVPAALVKQLVHTGEAARIGGNRRELSIFFSDIAGFTPISEEMSPEDLMLHLSEYLDQMTRTIAEHSGTVDKFIGDAVMAFWGAPVPQPEHAYLACMAALHCHRHVLKLNANWVAEGKTALPTRFGIHTGEVVVGNVGSSERMNYSILGDAVNVASRLEGANKVYGTSIIVGETTYQQVADRLLFRPLDRVAVLGRKQGIMIYELIGEIGDELPEGTMDLCDGFSAALEAYQQQKWTEALDQFRNLRQAFPGDAPTALFVERCEVLIADPPGDEWDGVTQLTAK